MVCAPLINRRDNRRSLAVLDRKELAHLGAFNVARLSRGVVEIAAATAENHEIVVLSRLSTSSI